MNKLKNLFQNQGYLTKDQLKNYSTDNEVNYDIVKMILSDLGIKIYEIEPEKKLKSISGEYEKCVLCGKKTDVKVSEKVENRYGYIVGVGQLCKGCQEEL